MGRPSVLCNRRTAGEPILKATDDVSGVTSEKPQRGRRKARRIPLIADDNDLLLVAHGCILEVALWIQPPFQDIPIDDERARNQPVAFALFERSYINKDCPGSRCVAGLAGLLILPAFAARGSGSSSSPTQSGLT